MWLPSDEPLPETEPPLPPLLLRPFMAAMTRAINVACSSRSARLGSTTDSHAFLIEVGVCCVGSAMASLSARIAVAGASGAIYGKEG